MDFRSVGDDHGPARPPHAPSAAAAPSTHSRPGRRKHIDWATRTVRLELFIVIVGCALLLAATSLYLGFNNNVVNSEFDRVAQNKYQAVFLNGGITSGSVLYSTYFGHITKINDRYVVLDNVYYLTSDQTSQNNQASPQLTKLGCQQLHSPYDEMVINRTQVAFWENLRDDGKVVQAIKQFISQNPNGPNCSVQSNTGTQTPAKSTQNTTTTTPPTTKSSKKQTP